MRPSASGFGFGGATGCAGKAAQSVRSESDRSFGSGPRTTSRAKACAGESAQAVAVTLRPRLFEFSATAETACAGGAAQAVVSLCDGDLEDVEQAVLVSLCDRDLEEMEEAVLLGDGDFEEAEREVTPSSSSFSAASSASSSDSSSASAYSSSVTSRACAGGAAQKVASLGDFIFAETEQGVASLRGA